MSANLSPAPANLSPVPANLSPVTPASATRPRVASRSDESSQRTERGWLESGLYVMTLPITLTVRMMLAPMNWMFGARPGS